MADRNLAVAVLAIIISYQNAKDLMYSIRLLEHHQSKSAIVAEEGSALLDALAAGENQISSRYAAIYREFGDKFRLADGETNNKLSRIAQLIDMKITKRLQPAVVSSDVVLNYSRITQDAEIFRRAALGILEERQSLFLQRASQEGSASSTPALTADDKSSTYSTDEPANPITKVTDSTTQPDSQPSVECVPVTEWSESERKKKAVPRSRLSRFFSNKKPKKQKQLPNMPAQPLLALDYKQRESKPHIEVRETSRNSLADRSWFVNDDEQIPIVPPQPSLRHDSTTLGIWDWPQQERPTTSIGIRPKTAPLEKHESLRRTSSLTRFDSPLFAGERLRIITRSRSGTNESGTDGSRTTASTPSDTSSALWNSSPRSVASSTEENRNSEEDSPPPIPEKSPFRATSIKSRRLHSRSATVSTMDSLPEQLHPAQCEYESSVQPIVPFASELLVPTAYEPARLHPAFQPEYSSPDAPLCMAPSARPLAPKPSNVVAASDSTCSGVPETALVGPPSKQNGYWGFCKGAWEIREDSSPTREFSRSGFQIQHRPSGIYNFVSVIQCKHCNFQSDLITKKPVSLDDSVYTTTSGAMYRWIFLAKSHIRCTSTGTWLTGENGGSAGYSYGCLFCSDRGRAAGVYTDVGMLMSHIVSEHGEMLRSEDVQRRTKCIYGRAARSSEAFDVCVLGKPAGEW